MTEFRAIQYLHREYGSDIFLAFMQFYGGRIETLKLLNSLKARSDVDALVKVMRFAMPYRVFAENDI